MTTPQIGYRFDAYGKEWRVVKVSASTCVVESGGKRETVRHQFVFGFGR